MVDVRVRDRLAAEDRQAHERWARLIQDFDGVVAASRDSNADDEHDPEGATIAFERSQIRALIGQAEHQVREIDAALRRLDAGTYGTCELCGTGIGDERLEARPTARVCMVCAASGRR